MTRLLAVGLVGLLLALGPSAGAQTLPGTASAELRDPAGKLVANAELREAQGEVLITLTFPQGSAMTGTHAVHLHERGSCSPPDFVDAGGIFNPRGRQHGLLNPDGPMVGDLPDMVLGPLGLVRYNISAPLATLRPGPASLLGPGGTAIVIDAGLDDNRSQPDGNSGARIACGVILGPGQTALPASGGASSPLTPLTVGAAGLILVAAGIAQRWWRRRDEPGV